MRKFDLLISNITESEVISEKQGYKPINNNSIINYAELLTPCIDKYEFEERAGIMEYEGNLPRPEAEKQAYLDLKEKYKESEPSEPNKMF